MSEQEKDRAEESQGQKSLFSLSDKVKTGLKYVGIGALAIGGLFLLTKPPILFVALRLAATLAVVGGVGYGVTSLVRSVIGSSNKPEASEKPKTQKKMKKTHLFSRRTIKIQEPKSDFNVKTKLENSNVKDHKQTRKPKQTVQKPK